MSPLTLDRNKFRGASIGHAKNTRWSELRLFYPHDCFCFSLPCGGTIEDAGFHCPHSGFFHKRPIAYYAPEQNIVIS